MSLPSKAVRIMRCEHLGRPGKGRHVPKGKGHFSKKWGKPHHHTLQARYEIEMITFYKSWIALCLGSFQECDFE